MIRSLPPSTQPRRPAEFPPERPVRSLRAVYYAFSRFLLGGAPLGRAVSTVLLVLAGLWATGLLPGRWAVTALWLSLLAAHITLAAALRRKSYVVFEAAPHPQATEPFAAESRTPVYVTGLLSVEGKCRRFTFLPAYYRTFATREHAILALVRTRGLWGLASLPEDEPGMWYAFVTPDQIRSVTSGKIRFDGQIFDAVALSYSLTAPAKHRFQREKTTTETLYIAATNAQDAARLCSDLVFDALSETAAAQQTTVAVPTRK